MGTVICNTLMTLGAPGKNETTSPIETADILSGVSPTLAPVPPPLATRNYALVWFFLRERL